LEHEEYGILFTGTATLPSHMHSPLEIKQYFLAFGINFRNDSAMNLPDKPANRLPPEE